MEMMMHAREKVMALVDGELDPADAPEVVQALANSPPLVGDLQTFLAMARQRLAAPFVAIGREPVPQHLIDLLMHAPMGEAHTRDARAGESVLANLKSAAGRLVERYRSASVWSQAAGPALAGAAVATFAWVLLPTSSVGAHADLAQALNEAVSGSKAMVATAIQPTLTFRHKNGSLCRQYEASYNAKQVSYAVACRVQSGEWRVAIATQPSTMGTYGTATPEARRPVDEFVAAHSAQDYTSSETEADALQSRLPPK
jgi:hypothetical protein